MIRKAAGVEEKIIRRTNTWSEIAIQPEAISLKPWVAPDLVGSAAAKQGADNRSRAENGSTVRLWAKPRGTRLAPAKARIRARKSGPCRSCTAAGTAFSRAYSRLFRSEGYTAELQ